MTVHRRLGQDIYRDDRFKLKNLTDQTKLGKFSLALPPTNTTITLSFPTTSGTIALASSSDGLIDHGDLTGLPGGDDHNLGVTDDVEFASLTIDNVVVNNDEIQASINLTVEADDDLYLTADTGMLYLDGEGGINMNTDGGDILLVSLADDIILRTNDDILFQPVRDEVHYISMINTNSEAKLHFVGQDGIISSELGEIRLEDEKLVIGTSVAASRLHVYDNTDADVSTDGLTIEQDGTGDAKATFLLTGGDAWTIGLDNSRSDGFVIDLGTTIGAAPMHLLTRTGDLYINFAGYLGGKVVQQFKATTNTDHIIYQLDCKKGGTDATTAFASNMKFTLANKARAAEDIGNFRWGWDDITAGAEVGTFTLSTFDDKNFSGVVIPFKIIGRETFIGDPTGTSYTKVEDDGTLEFNGDAKVWRDELNELIGRRLESPSSNITQNDAEGSVTFNDSCTLSDYVVMNIQLNHDWDMATAVEPHIHWWQTSSDLPNWLIQHRWQTNGQTKNTTWTDMPRDSEIFTYTSGTLNQITDFGGITVPDPVGISDILQIRLLRDTNNDSGEFAGTDPLTGDVDAVNLDVHIHIDTVGSRTEYSK